MHPATFKIAKSNRTRAEVRASSDPCDMTRRRRSALVMLQRRESNSEEINCLEARSVNSHTLSPISLKVEVSKSNQAEQCTMELCKKWHSYIKRQLVGNAAKVRKLQGLFIPSTCVFFLFCFLPSLLVTMPRVVFVFCPGNGAGILSEHRWCKHATRRTRQKQGARREPVQQMQPITQVASSLCLPKEEASNSKVPSQFAADWMSTSLPVHG